MAGVGRPTFHTCSTCVASPASAAIAVSQRRWIGLRPMPLPWPLGRGMVGLAVRSLRLLPCCQTSSLLSDVKPVTSQPLSEISRASSRTKAIVNCPLSWSWFSKICMLGAMDRVKKQWSLKSSTSAPGKKMKSAYFDSRHGNRGRT